MSSKIVNRACESCRLSKVRCKQAPEGTPFAQQGTCQRCAAAGKPCIYTAPRRTRQKRTDVRVRELEQEVKALGERLRIGYEKQVSEHHESQSQDDHNSLTSIPKPSYSDRLAKPSQALRPILDPVGAGLLSMQYATRLFDRYVLDLAPQRPLVVFPPGTCAAQVRANTPIVFLAILVAASGTLDTALCARLNHILVEGYAESIVIRGDETIELIQALLVSTNWNFPGGSYNHLKFYQQINMAASVAVSIDLGEPETWAGGNNTDNSPAQDHGLGQQRTLLGCYICCSSISLNYHRQNMFPFTPQMEHCLHDLETSPFALPSDPILAAWARLQHIVDLSDAALGLRADNTHKDFMDAGFQLSLSNCTKQLETWRTSTPFVDVNGPLLVQYHAVVCLVHQSCLYTEYSASDFKPPYIINIPSSNDRKTTDPLLTPAHLSSIQICISSTQAVLDTFLSMSVRMLVCGPVALYARMGHAVFVLMKICVSTATPGGVLHGVVDSATVKMSDYLDRTIECLTEICKHQCRLASPWLAITTRLRQWYDTYVASGSENEMNNGTSKLIQLLRLFELTDEEDTPSPALEDSGRKGRQHDQAIMTEREQSGVACLPDDDVSDTNTLMYQHQAHPLNPCLDDNDYSRFPEFVSDDWDKWIDAPPSFTFETTD